MITVAGGILLAAFVILMLIGFAVWAQKAFQFVRANAGVFFVVAFALVYGYLMYQWGSH